MKISRIFLENFRGYQRLDLELDSRFNLIVGDNGSGKTAILEALKVVIGSFFLGIKNYNSKGILVDDIHIRTFNDNEEYLFPVEVGAYGELNKQKIKWKRGLNGIKNRTTSVYADQIKFISREMDNEVREGKIVNLPLIAYYATGRLFDQAKEEEKDKEIQLASRFRAYDNCLDAKSTYQHFQNWYRGKELSKIQKRKTDESLKVVRNAIVENIPDCRNIFYEFDPEKQQGLKIQLRDERILPFHSLSDGTRNFFAIVADMAYKCVTLNPHHKSDALKQTNGVVLIDELDLHLHPEWQRKIINVLKDTFPKIQFITTTHSPFLIQETSKKQLIRLKNNQVESISSGVNLSIEDIAEEIQYVDNPQWSKKRQLMFEKARSYYKAVKDGKDTDEMKKELDEAMKPFAQDTALYALLEQEIIVSEYKNNKRKKK